MAHGLKYHLVIRYAMISTWKKVTDCRIEKRVCVKYRYSVILTRSFQAIRPMVGRVDVESSAVKVEDSEFARTLRSTLRYLSRHLLPGTASRQKCIVIMVYSHTHMLVVQDNLGIFGLIVRTIMDLARAQCNPPSPGVEYRTASP